jgi:3-methyladenine DNA glycosylase/8-oxoguanine DNA glycosylase
MPNRAVKYSQVPACRSASLRWIVAPMDWRRLILAHGWVHLAPFEWSDETEALRRPVRLAEREHAWVTLMARRRAGNSEVRAKVEAGVAEGRVAVRKQIARILRLDDDFSHFHALCAHDPLLRPLRHVRCGGLLRGADAFEDIVKTVCTINCDWRNTKRMCQRLCEIGGGNFPAADEVLRLSERQLAAKTACGYRARTIRTLAKLTSAGRLPLDDWAAAGDFQRIRAALGDIWGIGPYALGHMLVLLGDYSCIPVDSEVIKYLRKTHFEGREVSAKEAVTPYERYGPLRFLAFKFGRMARRENYIDDE